MLSEKTRIELYANEDDVYDKDEMWALFNPDKNDSFFPEGSRRFWGIESDNGCYLACWEESTRERRSTTIPAGICIVKDKRAIATVPIEGVTSAAPANDGTTAVIVDSGDIFLVLDSDGNELFRESFESNAFTLAISPDGEHVAISTANPDNAVHIFEAKTGQYLGRTENIGSNVLGYLRFASHEGSRVVETFDLAPDWEGDAHPNRKEVIDRISVEPQMDVLSLDGVGILVESDETEWHYIPDQQVTKKKGPLRIPGVNLMTSCNLEIEPLSAAVIYQNPKEALESKFELCGDCKDAISVYPGEKVEQTR